MAKPHPKPLSDQRQLQFDLESMAMWIRGIDRPLRVRQLIEALVRFGYCYQGDAERVATDAPAERFLGVWLIKASKSDLAGVVGLSTPTLKRCIQFLRRNGSDLIAVEFGDNEAHDFAINLSEIRGADPRPPRPIPRLDPVGRSPTDPGIRGGDQGGIRGDQFGEMIPPLTPGSGGGSGGDQAPPIPIGGIFPPPPPTIPNPKSSAAPAARLGLTITVEHFTKRHLAAELVAAALGRSYVAESDVDDLLAFLCWTSRQPTGKRSDLGEIANKPAFFAWALGARDRWIDRATDEDRERGQRLRELLRSEAGQLATEVPF